jgi:hypothetical protein
MGALGSGRVGTRRTVEDSLVLSVGELARQRMLAPNIFDWEYVPVQTGAGQPGTHLTVQSDTRNPGHYSMHLRYHIPGGRELFDAIVPVTTTRTPWGTLRWWFACPFTVGERTCGRRVGKLGSAQESDGVSD